MAKKTEPKEGLLSKVLSKFTRTGTKQTGSKISAPKPDLPELKLIFFIIGWDQATVISGVFEEEKVRFHFISKGRGTANSDILDILGIGVSEKAVALCIEQAVLVPVLMKEVRKKLGFNSRGAGIAFTVPISGINSPIMRIFKQSIHKNEKIAAEFEAAKSGASKLEAGKGESMANDINHDLIIAIVNQGYSDVLMNTAREAGATGGTIINARGQAHEGAVKFLGISVQDEKEIILVLTGRDKKVPIMRAVCDAHGLNSQAQGIVFSLPVENVLGLNFE